MNEFDASTLFAIDSDEAELSLALFPVAHTVVILLSLVRIPTEP
jgi:hypothetical protein